MMMMMKERKEKKEEKRQRNLLNKIFLWRQLECMHRLCREDVVCVCVCRDELAEGQSVEVGRVAHTC